MKAFLISNPKSGGYNLKKIKYIVSELKKYNIEVDEYRLQKEEKIDIPIEKIDSKKYKILLFAFGDGTVNSACNALIKRSDYKEFNIGIIPMGTANILASELETDKINKFIKSVIDNNTKKLCLGELYSGGELIRYFSLMASAGFDSVLVKSVDDNIKIKERFGKLAYCFEFIKILFKKNFSKIKTIIDGKEYENVLTCASNGRYYGAKITMAKANISKNIFQVIIFKKFSILSIIKYVLTKKSKNVLIFDTNYLQIESNKNDYPLQIDGDYYCNLPITIKITDKYLNVFYNK